MTGDLVVGFLVSLRRRGAPAWQRLQAARAVEWNQALVLNRADVDFSWYKLKLRELAEKEQRIGSDQVCSGGTPGEGAPGTTDSAEPEAMRARMRVLHHPKSTEEAYVVDGRGVRGLAQSLILRRPAGPIGR